MAIIPQLSLFSWNEIEELGDLERLRLVLENMPDEAFMKKLEKERGKGRDEYPVRGCGMLYWQASSSSTKVMPSFCGNCPGTGSFGPCAVSMEKPPPRGLSAGF